MRKEYVMKIRESFILNGLVFSGIYLYLWRGINPALYYQWQEPVFLFTPEFFQRFVRFPGGLTEYAAAWLAQFYYYPWLGALIITGLLTVVAIHSKFILDSFLKSHLNRFFQWVPVGLLLVFHNDYLHPLAYSLAFLFVVSFTRIYLVAAHRSGWFRGSLAFILAGGLYYLAGGAFLLFSLVGALYEWFCKKNRRLSLGFIFFLVGFPVLWRQLVNYLPWREAFFSLIALEQANQPAYLTYLLYGFIPAAILGLIIAQRKLPRPTPRFSPVGSFFEKRFPRWLVYGAFIVVAGACIFFTRDLKTSAMIEIDYFARQQQWEKILERAPQRMSGSELIAFHTNRALFHTGQLLERLFAFPQTWGVKGLIFSKAFSFQVPLRRSDLMFELGYINEAQHWAHEALMIWGETPSILRRLVQVYLVKNEVNPARTFLNSLKQTCHWHLPIPPDLPILTDSLQCHFVPEIENLQAQQPVRDFVVNADYPRLDLMNLVERHPQNKMAVEYLIAFDLLTGQLTRLIDYSKYLKDLGYQRLPRHFEEALLIYMAKTGQQTLTLPAGWQIRAATFQDFVRFNQIVAQHQGNVNLAQADLKREFKDTYWYYLLFLKPKE